MCLPLLILRSYAQILCLFSLPPVNRGRDPLDFLLDLQDVWPILPQRMEF